MHVAVQACLSKMGTALAARRAGRRRDGVNIPYYYLSRSVLVFCVLSVPQTSKVSANRRERGGVTVLAVP